VPVEPDDAAGKPDGQNRVERMLERTIVLFAKAMVALGLAALVYGALVMSFFFCCGVESGRYVDPSRSPLGAIATILVIWPLVGFLCFALQGGPSDLLVAIKKFARAAWRAVRRHAEA
jgi:hydrogenase-4 membrane subunit HyfE